jgi:hypothetical protein
MFMHNMMLINKKLISLSFILMVSLSILVGCQTKPTVTETTVQTVMDQSGLPWKIEVNKWEVTDDLSGSQAAQQYNGDVVQIQYNEKPSDGMSFLLVELTVTKQVAGALSFSWKNVSIKDSTGGRYARMANDTFLENYNFPRIKSTDLTLGENKGFACFEIPAGQPRTH